MLEAKSLTAGYHGRPVVTGVSLLITPGTLTAVLGANGAGKSTLLGALNGAVTPQRGEVLLDGAPLSSYARHTVARRIAVVAQEADVRFPVTVMEFVLGGRYAWSASRGWGWESAHDVEIAGQVLGETGLNALRGELLSELSGGERQRAVLARALATEAPVLLLDEPTANLDLASQAAMLALVRERADRDGAAALVVTHDVNLAAAFADRILLMKHGQVLSTGKPGEVLSDRLLEEVFGIRVLVDANPVTGAPRITPVHERRAGATFNP